MTGPLLTIGVRVHSDLVPARQRARQISQLLGFDAMDQARVAAAVSEIARNAIQYAGCGEVEFFVELDPECAESPCLLISVSDRGPGIADVRAVLDGAPETGGSGLGLVNARRLVDRLDIDSTPGGGTVVVLEKRLPAGHPPFTAPELAAVTHELARTPHLDPYEEIRRQNQELINAMEELRTRQEDLVRLNRELEDTNRGVVALYAELDEKALHLRRADELKTRFLSNMSHEFRTPVNSILALSKLLLDRIDGPLTEDQARQVTFIQRSAQDLSDLVNDLLDIAKVEAGRTTVKAAETGVGNLFGGLRGMFRPLLASAAVNLVFEDTAEIPAMYTDEGKVSQILRNLISNALKFTEQGEVRVSASYDPAGGMVVFAVADTGIGIAPEDHERIFHEFAQLDNPLQNRVRGTGLGLPLTRRLTELLDGAISLESRPGEGSTFRVALPLTHRDAWRLSEAEPRTEPDISRFPVLVVDQDAEAIILYEKYLKRTGFQVLSAADAMQARRLLDEIRPAAIILDGSAAGGMNWDFLLDLKRDDQTRGIPVIVVSGPGEREKARDLGADEFSLKPLDRSWLVAALKRFMRQAPREYVLIVDDDDVSRYLMREMLGHTRYEPAEACGGASALEMARQLHPRAILLDLVMPGMDGFQVLERLAADPVLRRIPVIIMTSKALEDQERRFLSSRTVAVISKEAMSREGATDLFRQALASAEAASAAAVRGATNE